jgi:type 1 glutamine amidotransferase
MKRVTVILFFLLSAWMVHAQTPAKRVLVFSKVTGYFHESIPDGIKIIEKLGAENNFEIYSTKDSTYFTDDSLKKYAAIIFLNTSGGNMLSPDQKRAMEKYIRAGRGFVGVHCASANFKRVPAPEPDWTWYHKLVGATQTNHPAPSWGTLHVVDNKNASTKHLPKEWLWYEEWYNFKDIQPDLHVLIKVDEATYKGGENGSDHPLAWYHDYDGGRSFYTALGHFAPAYTNPLFVKHLLAGIQYAMGERTVLTEGKKATSK